MYVCVCACVCVGGGGGEAEGGEGGVERGKPLVPLASTNYVSNLITEKSNELAESLGKSHNEKSHKIIWFQLHTF